MLSREERELKQPLNKTSTKYIGPFRISHVSRNGAITLQTADGSIYPMIVLAHRLKFAFRDHKDFTQA